MPLLLLALVLCSCSPKRTDNNVLLQTKYPNVPTMSSAEDAGNAK